MISASEGGFTSPKRPHTTSLEASNAVGCAVQCTYRMMKRAAMASKADPRTKRINVRASAKQENLMRRGAAERGLTLTEFIVETACREAEETLADQRVFVLPHDRWVAFMKALDGPPKAHPRMDRLFAESSIIEKDHEGGPKDSSPKGPKTARNSFK